MNQFFDVPAGGRRVAALCAAALLLAAVATEGADTGSVPMAAAWTVSGALLSAAVAVRRGRFDAVAAAGVVASCLVTLVNTQLAARPEATFGLVETCALLLVVVRSTRLRPPLRATALAGGALVALTVIVLRLPPAEYKRLVPFVAPAFWFAAALATVLGLYLRLLDRYRAQDHEAGLQAQRLDYARELHDFVGHHVTAIVAQIKAVRYVTAAGRPPSPQELDGMLAAVEEAGSQAMRSMHGMVAVLRSPGGPAAPAGPGGQLADLRTLTERISATGPATTLTLDPRLAAGGLPPGIATTVHHVVREALTNVRKHARRARTVTVDVRLDGDTARPAVLVAVTDDGPDAAAHGDAPPHPTDGPAAAPREPRSGYGLAGLSERAAMVGGTVTAGARADVGWVVEARVPLPGPLPLPGDDRRTATLDA
ncbi:MULTISPECIES: sensor histidine kinase [Streptomyces]|uniref:sensor histidine kinase n=1 Tax=Streptomyces TaxID=1883 RepID=UPI0023DD0DA5|nr:histidine kinase [Streptomyces sp. FXJ1.172]WEP00928.1 histidine kinase [Streptomyces sp. FXJ1.172]